MQSLPSDLAAQKWISRGRGFRRRAEARATLAAPVAAYVMAERAELCVPALEHGVAPGALGIEDMFGATGATDTQVRFVLHQIAKAV